MNDPVPGLDRAEYLRRWSQLHSGAGTGGVVGWWLTLVHALARPLVRVGAGPNLITVLGVVVAALAVLPAVAGGRWLLVAAAVVVLSGLIDNLDGAVAVLTGRVTRWGHLLDSLCDRVSDAIYVLLLWLVGAPGLLAVAGGAVAWLQEYLRARAAAGGMSRIEVVTVSERPTRVIVTTMFLLAGGVYPGGAAAWAGAGAAAWAVLGVVGLVQLGLVAHARLTDPGPD